MSNENLKIRGLVFFSFTLIVHNAINHEKGEITIIDSSYTKTLCDAIQHFREYITQNLGSDSITAIGYIRIADNLQQYVSGKDLSTHSELVIQEYYSLTVGVPPFETPPSKSKERYARAIRMIRGILHNEEPKRRYINHPLRCPAPY